MKKTLLVLSIAILVTAAAPLTPPPAIVGGGSSTTMRGVVAPDCYTFTVDNASSDSIGNVRVSGAMTYADFNVTTTASYEQSICFVAAAATVNGVAVTYPNSGDVQLTSGVWVKVAWQSSSLVEVADDNSHNSPIRQ